MPDSVKVKIISDPSFMSPGLCMQGQIYLCPPQINKMVKLYKSNTEHQRDRVLMNELLHHMMYLNFGDKIATQTKQFYAGKDFDTYWQIQANQELEEALSDIVTIKFAPETFYERLTHSYPFTGALMEKTLRDILPNGFKAIEAGEFAKFGPKKVDDLKMILRMELMDAGFNDPDLEEQIYKPGMESLEKFAQDRAKEIRDSFT